MPHIIYGALLLYKRLKYCKRHFVKFLALGEPNASCSNWVLSEVFRKYAYRPSICPVKIKNTEYSMSIITCFGICTV